MNLSRPALRQNRRGVASVVAASLAMVAIPASTTAMASVETDTRAELARFMAVMREVKANYVEPVSDEKLIDGAIQGMLSSLDAHSGYLDASDFTQLRTTTDGEYPGLGLSVTQEDGAVKVIAPQSGTPADRAGIKAGDYITHIDGEYLGGYTLDEAVAKMRGPAGTSVKLTLIRMGREQPIEVTVRRERIVLRPVTWEVKNNVGVVKLSSFSNGATREITAAMNAVQRQLGRQPTGWVLDLRGNAGGLLDEAVEVSDLFLERGNIVSQRGRVAAENESWAAQAGDITRGQPIVVLIDAGSASASEIVAGALQDNRRALVMGETSFGKGSVQTIVPLSNTTALRLTTARYYTPSGRSVQEGGIAPDIRVPQLTDPDYRRRPVIREADLRRHLVNQARVDDRVVEEDTATDPRFSQTPEQLRAAGITDFQLDYATRAVARLAQTRTPAAVAGSAAPRPSGGGSGGR